ncbi:MAG: TatD family hydrolase [Spirochaetaceae bacterium]|nr:TatD family hydrolase [Spirochaetaceae bacterium]
MLADAHIHLDDLLDRDPSFPERLARISWIGCAASHDAAAYARTEAMRARLAAGAAGSARASFVASFGIHPQNVVWDHADFLAGLAMGGTIAAIGEAGFDFYGDRPERVRNPKNESAQRALFEYQLELADRSGLPLLLHLRRAMDLAFAYAPRLKRLRGAVFHSYSGTADEIAALLGRGVRAYFSFGASVLNGNKRARVACAAVPEDRLLSETDAPWQPPRREGAPPPGGRFCVPEDLEPIVVGIAGIRGVAAARAAEVLERNFRAAYGEQPA